MYKTLLSFINKLKTKAKSKFIVSSLLLLLLLSTSLIIINFYLLGMNSFADFQLFFLLISFKLNNKLIFSCDFKKF
jgi:hypothetical protein